MNGTVNVNEPVDLVILDSAGFSRFVVHVRRLWGRRTIGGTDYLLRDFSMDGTRIGDRYIGNVNLTYEQETG